MQKPGIVAHGMTFDAFGYDGSTTTGLEFGIKAGNVSDNAGYTEVAAQTITMVDDSINRLVLDYTNGEIGIEGRLKTKTFFPLWCVHTSGGAITHFHDLRSAQCVKIASNVHDNLKGYRGTELDQYVIGRPDLVQYLNNSNTRCSTSGEDERVVVAPWQHSGGVSMNGPTDGFSITEPGPGADGVGSVLFKYGDDSAYEECFATISHRFFEGYTAAPSGRVDYGSFTICAKPSQELSGTGFTLLGQRRQNGGDNVQTLCYVNSSGLFYFRGISSYNVQSDSAACNYGEWNVWTVVMPSASATELDVYHNAVEVASTTSTSSPTWLSGWSGSLNGSNQGCSWYGAGDFGDDGSLDSSLYQIFGVPTGYLWMGPIIVTGENGIVSSGAVLNLYNYLTGNN